MLDVLQVLLPRSNTIGHSASFLYLVRLSVWHVAESDLGIRFWYMEVAGVLSHVRIALVYDLMEPLRPVVDRTVLKFILSHTFLPSDFIKSPKGVCRLHPDMARTVATAFVDDAMVCEVVEKACSVLRLSGQQPTG